MEIFDSVVLNRVVETMVEPISFFSTNYFGATDTQTAETIMFDVTDQKRRITPVVHPLVRGKVIEGPGYTTKSFTPAYLKDERIFNPNKYFSRLAGEPIGAPLTPMQRLQSSAAWHVDDQMKMLARRKEVWSAEVLRTGGLVVAGEGYDQVSLSFGRDPSLTITLTGADLWSAGTADPLGDLEDASQQIFDLSGAVAKTVVMTADVWKVFKKNPDVEKELSTLRRDSNGAVLATGPLAAPKNGVRYMGHVGDFDIYVYGGKYIDPLDNTEKDVLPPGTVMLLSDDVDGVMHYGAIRDLDAGLQARSYFVKSWTEPSPSARFMLMQSSVLPVAYRPNATASLKVL
jgi:hypothetical protein